MNENNPVSFSPWGNLQLPYGIASQRLPTGLENHAAYIEYLSQAARYRDWWGWMDRTKLDVQDPTSTTPNAWLFPLKVNVPDMVAEKHANALFGEADGNEDGNLIEIRFKDKKGNEENDACLSAAELVSRVMRESRLAGHLHQAAYFSQILGGAVFRVNYRPDLVTPISPNPIRVEPLPVNYFIPIYDPANPWDLIEAHVVYDISKDEAKAKYGITTDERLVLFHERWSRTEHSIEVGNQVVKMMYKGVDVPMPERNPFGFVPLIYIPHYKRMGSFYGTSIIPTLEAVTMELNSTLADRGDNIKAAANNNYFMRNVSANVRVRKISESFPAVVDLGANAMGNKDPEIIRFETGELKEAQTGFTAELWNIVEKAGAVPEVVWGADKMGTQRSSLTFSFATWSMTSHIKKERIHWGTGFEVMARMILSMAVAKGMPGANPEWLTLTPVVKWDVIMPRDRMEMVNETAVRLGGKPSMSIVRAVKMLSDGEDPLQHVEQIEEDMQAMAQMDQSSQIQAVQGTNGVTAKPNAEFAKDVAA